MADNEKPKEPVKKPAILYIIGGNSWDIPHDPEGVRRAFTKQDHEVIIMGASEEKGALHGQKDILLQDIGAEVDKLAKAGKPFTVYLDTHGGMRDDTHHIMLGDQFDRAKLYDEIKKAHPDTQTFTVTVKRGTETYRQFDRRAGIDTAKPMSFVEVQSAVDKVRNIGTSTKYTQEESEDENFQGTPYGGGGIFGGSYKPVSIEIKPEGSDKIYTIPLSRATPTKDLFRTLTQHAGDTPFSIFSTACYGGGACTDLDKHTPKGTVFVSLSDGYQPVYVSDTEALIRAVGGLGRPDFSKMYDAHNLINDQGGTLTVTRPGEKEPVLKVSREGKKPDVAKIRKQLEAEGGSWTLTKPGSPKPTKVHEVSKGDELNENLFWSFVKQEFISEGGTLEVTLTGKDPVKFPYKPLDEKDWDKAAALLEEKAGILEVTTPAKETMKVEFKPLELPLNAQNMLMVYLQHSMAGSNIEKEKKVLPAPIIGVSGIGIADLDKKLWNVGLIPNEQELQKIYEVWEKQGGTLTVTPDGKEPVFNIKEWQKARTMLGEQGGTLTVTTPAKETLAVHFKKPDEKTLEKAQAVLAAGGPLKITHPGTKEEALTIDALPMEKGALSDMKKYIAAERIGKSNKPLKDSKLYSEALMLSLASDPTANESVRNVKAYRDFYRALTPEFKGDRMALATDALSRGVRPEKVTHRVDSSFFSSHTRHETAMTMAIRTENADLVGLLVKHGQKLNDDYAAQAVERGDKAFAGRILALHGKEKFEADDKLGSRSLVVAVSGKNEEMFRYLEKKGAQLNSNAKDPALLDALFESRFTASRYDHKKHERFLKYLVEEKKVPVFNAHQKTGGALYTSAHFGKEAFEYMLDKTVKQSGKKPSELLGMPAEAHYDGETIVHRIAAFGEPDVLEIILKHRPEDLNKPTRDYEKASPLIKAFTFGNHGTAKKLLEMKADIHVAREHKDLGDMALDPIGARSKDALPMVKLLVENGYNVFAQGKETNSIGHRIDGTFKERARYRAGNKEDEITAYLDKKEKEIHANADKFAAATRDMKKPDILGKIQEKDSGFTPAVLKSILELEDYEQSERDKPKKRFTPEQRQTIKEVLEATKKVGLLDSYHQSHAGLTIPALDQFLGSGLQGAPIRAAQENKTHLPL